MSFHDQATTGLQRFKAKSVLYVVPCLLVLLLAATACRTDSSSATSTVPLDNGRSAGPTTTKALPPPTSTALPRSTATSPPNAKVDNHGQFSDADAWVSTRPAGTPALYWWPQVLAPLLPSDSAPYIAPADVYKAFSDPANSDLPPETVAQATDTAKALLRAEETGQGKEQFPEMFGATQDQYGNPLPPDMASPTKIGVEPTVLAAAAALDPNASASAPADGTPDPGYIRVRLIWTSPQPSYGTPGQQPYFDIALRQGPDRMYVIHCWDIPNASC